MSDATTTELLYRPVDELAGMVRAGDVSARELVQASLDRIDGGRAAGQRVRRRVRRRGAGRRRRGHAGDDRPLAGVPIAIKNNTPVRASG
jgi:amidase